MKRLMRFSKLLMRAGTGIVIELMLAQWQFVFANRSDRNEDPGTFSPSIIQYNLTADNRYCELCDAGLVTLRNMSLPQTS